MRAQHGVDPRLPTSALSAVSVDHVGVETQRLVDLRSSLSRTAPPLDCGLSRFRAKDLADQGRRPLRAFEIFARPLRVLVIGTRGRASIFFVGMTLDLSGIGLAEADDVHRVAAIRDDLDSARPPAASRASGRRFRDKPEAPQLRSGTRSREAQIC